MNFPSPTPRSERVQLLPPETDRSCGAVTQSPLETAAQRLREVMVDLLQFGEDLNVRGHPLTKDDRRALTKIRVKVHNAILEIVKADT